MQGYESYLSELLANTLSGISFFMPEMVLVVTFVLTIVSDLLFPGRKSSVAFWICSSGILISGLVCLFQLPQIGTGITLFSQNLVIDRIAIHFKLIFIAVILLFLVFIRNNKCLKLHTKGTGDLYMLVPAILLGLNLMAMASSLLLIYLSIELVSIGSYLMVGYVSGQNKQTEAAMKYAIFGSVCSAIMLYGMSLLYAFTGTIDIISPAFTSNLSEITSPGIALAVILTLVGIGFKLSFVPFHFWSPDVYEGAPTPVTAFLSTAPKIAGFALLIRFMVPFHAFSITTKTQLFDFETTFTIIAILTMIAGNFAAIWQDNIKRMLAYSSIGHTGFAMMAIVSISQGGLNSLLFYFAIYAMMNMAAFMLVDRIEEQSGATGAKAYKGLGALLKVEMVCFVIVLISLTGLPPTAGFVAKLLVFSSAFEKYSASGSVWILALLITGAITTVVSLFYYLKIPLNAYLRKGENDIVLTSEKSLLTYVIVALSGALILFGLFPDILG